MGNVARFIQVVRRPAVNIAVFLVSLFALFAVEGEVSTAVASVGGQSHVGNFYPFLKAYSDRNEFSLSYLARPWPDLEAWRIGARAKMHELLAYNPLPAPKDARILESVKKDGYIRHLVRYSVTSDRQTEAFLLIPEHLEAPAPAILALHDHGGFYYFGKEKITETEGAPQVLQNHINSVYGGRAFADELARRGFVVLVPDAFYFGSQRLVPEELDGRFVDAEFCKLKRGCDEYIRKCNRISGSHEHLLAKTIFTAGSTWPGILFQGDRASIDYLLTRPEVDPDRIGCIGLSIGGFRSAHLFGLDPRVKVGVVAGWMTTYGSLLFDHLWFHTWMIYVPGQHAYLDLPDVVTLNAPRPLMVVNCLRDELFTLEGMKAAETKIATVYKKLDAAEKFRCKYYDEPHSLKIPAQNDAIAWLEKWLK